MGSTDERQDKNTDWGTQSPDSASDQGEVLCYDIVEMSDPSDSDTTPEDLEQRAREFRGEMGKLGTLDKETLAKLAAADRRDRAGRPVKSRERGWLARILSALGLLRTKGRLPRNGGERQDQADG